jgi:1,4-alpha-glucan branching enzyme
MRSRGNSGIWELFIPGITTGALYKYELRHRNTGSIHLKTDPYGQQFEARPQTASVVADPAPHAWQDQHWIEQRRSMDWLHQPVSIYEVHLGSWRTGPHGEFLGYRELAHRLVPYVQDLGFTHIELLPVTEHPLDASWGYQTTGYYAPTSRYGSPEDFRYFVEHCHRHGIGVILDWAPGHFPKDAHGLARFDGSALYEHEDPRRGEHRDWGTLIFNYGRNEVRNFLISSALYWMEEFHIDGLRVDAVASMLYLDYSRNPGDWTPNIHGGNENLEAIDFLRRLNQLTHELHPGTLMLAEESTAWPMVSRPTWLGGLGFSMKWNMGWMNDTLAYMSKDPVYRKYSHDMLTFSQLYAFTENFVLPFSHDEVVHGKQSMLNKMPGDEWQRFANLRLLYVYMYTHPGKKLLFMGCEFGQGREWDHSVQLDWYVLEYAHHQGVQKLVRDLNRLYRESAALHQFDFEGRGFEWIDCHDSSQSVLTYLRRGEHDSLVVALNFTPVLRRDYRIGVPFPGVYREVLNSDSEYYAGSNQGNGSGIYAEPIPWMGRPHSIIITLPPLAGVVLKPEAAG